jgi:VanZ family protein
MAVIFTASTDLGSTQHTSKWIGAVLRFFNPDVSTETILRVQVGVRKTGHFTGYAIFATLIWRARQRGFFVNGWNAKSAYFAEGLATIYAVSDEWHQSWVPTRMASGWDVLIDASGAALALSVIWMIGRFRRKW